MATKKPKLGLPPTPPASLSNPAMQEMINKGGSVLEPPVVPANPPGAAEDKLKSFTFKIYESELAQIRAIQDSLPKRDRISIHDFVVAAVKEKIDKAAKKHNPK
ncbi:hypothetical protein K3G63_21895 [Hymenobacter sp. HSC-4F20]|uniref:hypothetical protein n=1 Tax=Hymenobacter sp. HSC-4F20 TaxID=2864135 RepID=UPI001C73176A|nr:hypothetical protein [Hymenobacter sp. HSC-4F20]MBX0293113.1 hypothetical protein [Hymenobacter sp. HSC-4F20]